MLMNLDAAIIPIPLIPQRLKLIFNPCGRVIRTPGGEALIYDGMVINYTDLPDGHHNGIVSSQS